MAEHGFMKPNPALLDDLDKRKKRPQLAHELGEGAKCSKCGDDGCSGFQLHYWRKVCLNCRCGKADHNVFEEHDPGFYFVGKIFDRPLRSKAEEMEFCYGDLEAGDDSSSGDEKKKKKKTNASYAGVKKQKKTVKFDWIPPNVSKTLARRYMNDLPESAVPIAGSEGAHSRKTNLEKQFPLHDVEPTECHDLSPSEVQSMKDYVDKVKEHVVGQGVVTEIDGADFFPPPPSDEMLQQLEDQLAHKATIGSSGPSSPSGTYFARPFNGVGGSGHLSHLSGPRPFNGSTASSSNSSRNDSPSPTSSNEDNGTHVYTNGLSRPSKFEPKIGAFICDGDGSKPLASVAADAAANASLGPRGQICEGCKEEMSSGDVVVKAERAGTGKVWHPRCFKCHTCKELLADLLYYYESGKVYCARDYAAKAKIPRCAACDELIFATEYTGADDNVWHLKHFCCYECDRPLAGHKYIPIDSQPHCLTCFQKKRGQNCHTCGEMINPEDQRVSLEGTHWHATSQCFACAVCFVSLIGRKMTRKNDTVLCSSACFRKLTDNKSNKINSVADGAHDRAGGIVISQHSTLV